MNTSIRNRNESYFNILNSLPKKKQLILQLFSENPNSTSQEIHEKYLIPINEVVARVSDLKNEFLLVETGSKENRWTGRMNTTYRVVKNINERIDLINERFVELRDQKDKLIRDYKKGLSEYTKSIILKIMNSIDVKISRLGKTLNTLNDQV